MFNDLVGDSPIVPKPITDRLRRIPKIVMTGSCRITDEYLDYLDKGVVNGIFPKPLDRIIPNSLNAILKLTHESVLYGTDLTSLSILHEGDSEEGEFLRKIKDPNIIDIVINYRKTAREALGMKYWGV